MKPPKSNKLYEIPALVQYPLFNQRPKLLKVSYSIRAYFIVSHLSPLVNQPSFSLQFHILSLLQYYCLVSIRAYSLVSLFSLFNLYCLFSLLPISSSLLTLYPLFHFGLFSLLGIIAILPYNLSQPLQSFSPFQPFWPFESFQPY